MVQRGKSRRSAGSWQQRASAHIVRCPRCTRVVLVVVEGIDVASIALPLRQSPLLPEKLGHQPCGPAEVMGGGGGGRSCGGVLTISMKLSSVAGSFEM